MSLARDKQNELKSELLSEEGYANTVYLDSTGHPTVGIGHKITEKDNLNVGDKVPQAQIDSFFATDVKRITDAAKKKIKNFDTYGENFQQGVINFMFQLGENADLKFPKAFAHFNSGNIAEGVKELQLNSDGTGPSDWVQQTYDRSNRVAQKMLQDTPDPLSLKQKPQQLASNLNDQQFDAYFNSLQPKKQPSSPLSTKSVNNPTIASPEISSYLSQGEKPVVNSAGVAVQRPQFDLPIFPNNTAVLADLHGYLNSPRVMNNPRPEAPLIPASVRQVPGRPQQYLDENGRLLDGRLFITG